VFGSKAVVFCLFLDINCGVEMVEACEMDGGLSFGASIGCLEFLGDFWFWREHGRFWW
jgi:hypothetical protein